MSKSKQQQIFIFLGAPGSGKGTLARMCVDTLHWKQLSTGDLCRKHIAEGTLLGAEIDFAIKSGTLVSDSVIIDMVGQWLEKEITLETSIILDGFPRTVPQAEGFVKLMKNKLGNVRLRVIRFVIPDDVVIKRLSSRVVCSNRDCQRTFSSDPASSFLPKKSGVCDVCGFLLKEREDDKAETIALRLDGYHHHVEHLMNFYTKAGYAIEDISWQVSSEQVFKEFLMLVEQE